MRDIVKTTIPLLALCLAVGLCLSYVNALTKGPIEKRKIEDAEKKKKEVLPEAQTFEEIADWKTAAPEGHVLTGAFRGMRDGKTVGYVFSAAPKGYAGAMTVTIGIKRDGTVGAVSLGDNKETPGLGTKAGEAPFITQFAGKTIATPIELVKMTASGNQVQAIAGATISSRAMVVAVQHAAAVARELLKREGGKP